MAVWRRVVLGIALGSMCLSGTVLAQDMAEIRDLLRAERYEQALDLLVVRVRAEPDDTEARFLQGLQ